MTGEKRWPLVKLDVIWTRWEEAVVELRTAIAAHAPALEALHAERCP